MIPQYNTPYANQQQNQLIQQMLTSGMGTAPVQQHVVKVNGRPGAESFSLGADSDVLLLDNTAPIVWLVQTDGAGYKTLTPYDISLHQEVKQEDLIKKLEDRISKLEERLDAKPTYKPNSTESKQRKSEYNGSSVHGNDAR